MITINLIETDSILNGLTNLLTKELPFKVAYSLSKLFKKIKSENEFYIEQRNKLINQYAEKDKDNKIKINRDNSIPMIKGKIEEFQLKFKELNEIEFKVDFSPIKLEDLKLETIKGLDLYALDKFIIE